MCIRSPEELEALREAGRIAWLCLREMARGVRPGATTADLNAAAARVLVLHGARSAPMRVYKFPAETCISVNDEVVHGIPSRRVLQNGDLIKLDVTVEKDGFMADTAVTVTVGPASPTHRALIDSTRRAFRAATRVARAGHQIREIGQAIEREAQKHGVSVIRDLSGHGIGRTIHEEPTVPNYDDPNATALLVAGLVITIEPIFTLGTGAIALATDGWTVRTTDGTDAAHHEHTLVVTESDPLLLTAAA